MKCTDTALVLWSIHLLVLRAVRATWTSCLENSSGSEGGQKTRLRSPGKIPLWHHAQYTQCKPSQGQMIPRLLITAQTVLLGARVPTKSPLSLFPSFSLQERCNHSQRWCPPSPLPREGEKPSCPPQELSNSHLILFTVDCVDRK